MPDDDGRYHLTRRTPMRNRNTLRDVVPPNNLSAPTNASAPQPEHGFAAGSETGVSRVSLSPSTVAESEFELEIATPGLLVARRTFGGHELVVEHRGNEVTVILPGAMRLVGSRDDAFDLVDALLARSVSQRERE